MAAKPPQHFLYYWKDYTKDVRRGIATRRLQLNQNSPTMAEIGQHDVVWAFARPKTGHYILAARIEVEDSGANAAGSLAHGRGRRFFRSTADGTVFFKADGQPNMEPVMRRLGPTANAKRVGQAFQGANAVAEMDARAVGDVEATATGLAIDEELTQPAAASAWLTWREAAGTVPSIVAGPPERRERLLELYLRDRRQVTALKALYGGYCQLTGKRVWDGVAGDVTEVHHIEWLSRGGADTWDNMVVLSPDAHSIIHAVDAGFDPVSLTFEIGGRRMPLALNHHLKPKV